MTPTSREIVVICNTTPTRYFALASQLDLLSQICGGAIRVPRLVFDPEDDADDPPEFLSEIGASERYWAKRASTAEAAENWLRLGLLRTRGDLEVIDMSIEELERYAELASQATQSRFRLAAELGRGEAAVMAIAESRDWTAVMDDRDAITVLNQISPGTRTITTRDLLRSAVYDETLDTREADEVYRLMLERGYWGPPGLWV